MVEAEVSATLFWNSSSVSSVSASDSFAEKSPFAQAIISLLYMERTVMPTTSAVCHERIPERSCFQTGVADWPLSLSASYSRWAARILSAKMGRLFEMARKNMLAPIVNEGYSRATCWMDMERLLKPVPAERL